MRRVVKPEAPKKLKPFLTEEDLARLLRATSGSDFEARRDYAIIRRRRGTLPANQPYGPVDGLPVVIISAIAALPEMSA